MVSERASVCMLRPHPDNDSTAATGITVEARLTAPGILVCDYVLHEKPGRLRLPERHGGARTDGLWRHTCFEAFVSATGSTGYYEFNFSPAGDWAAYAFSHYRDGMTNVALVAAPGVHVEGKDTCLELSATVDLAGLTDLTAAPHLQVALSAVVEDTEGALSYWALQHAPGKPDFHHPDGFILELSPP